MLRYPLNDYPESSVFHKKSFYQYNNNTFYTTVACSYSSSIVIKYSMGRKLRGKGIAVGDMSGINWGRDDVLRALRVSRTEWL